MSVADSLAKIVLQKEALADCSLEDLQHLSAEYPFFAPVEFLLAVKLRPEDDIAYSRQLQKLSLYFNNPLWLDFQLNGYPGDVADPDTVVPAPTDIQNESAGNLQSTQTEHDSDNDEAEPVALPEDAIIVPARTKSNGELANENFAGVETNDDHTEVSTTPEDQSENQEIVPAEPVAVPEEIMIVPARTESDGGLANHNFARVETNDDPAEVSTTPEDQPKSQEIIRAETETGGSSFADQSNAVQTDTPSPGQLSFEPYHTVDYFASQGIRFVPDEKPADRFGQQLRSFTEWLKAMKRPTQVEIAKSGDTPVDENIQRLANHSLNVDEALTEAMAEVWIKQGNREKAIDIYNKLSLREPAKSAYFASLVEQVKNS